MLHGITGIDHPVIAVRDMQAARSAYERLGFTIPPRGSHLEWGTGNWCIMFEHDYLELRGVTDGAKYTHGLDQFLEKREGLMGIALATDDAEASFRMLIDGGLRLPQVRQLTRNFELPGGNVQPRFALCFLDEADTPGLFSVVLCQHLTPTLLRRPDWLVHSNGAKRVASITAVVEDPALIGDAYRKLFGNEAISSTNDGFSVELGRNQRILVTTLSGADKMHPRVPFASHGPGLVAVTLEVSDVGATECLLHSNGVKFVRAQAMLGVSPEDACGVVLAFAQES